MNRLEDQMRDKLRDLNTPPPENVWKNIERELHPAGVSRGVFMLPSHRIMAVAAAAALLISGTWLALHTSDSISPNMPSVVVAPVVAPAKTQPKPKQDVVPQVVLQQSVVALPKLPSFKKAGVPTETQTPIATTPQKNIIEATTAQQVVAQVTQPTEQQTITRKAWTPVEALASSTVSEIRFSERKIPRIFRADLRNPTMLAQTDKVTNYRDFFATVVDDVRKTNDGETSISERVFNSALVHGTELVKQIDLQAVAAELRDRLDGDEY